MICLGGDCGANNKQIEDLHIQEAYDAVTQDSESAKYIEVFDKFGNQKQVRWTLVRIFQS